MSALCVENTLPRAKDWGDISVLFMKRGLFPARAATIFFSKDYLRDHEKTHIEAEFECDHYQETFRNKHSPKQHAKTIHGNKDLICILCPKTLARKAYLLKHMESCEKKMFSHAKETNCDECEKTFDCSKKSS